jgi:hydrogenase maturation protein HypF
MGEKDIDEMIGIACDGAGFGLDGNTWGGEILQCCCGGFKRIGHLQEQPLIGGDLAATYPLRMAAGILQSNFDITEWLLSEKNHFPKKKMEVEIVLKQIKRNRNPVSSSCGRVLDAVAGLLDICFERTYEGEPAMKLESAALRGKNVLELRPKIHGGVIDTGEMVCEIFENRTKYSAADLANSAEAYIAESLAELAVEKAEETGINIIGFSGGVAYNEHITTTIKDVLKKNGRKLCIHNQVPPGDGGISFGQTIAASNFKH